MQVKLAGTTFQDMDSRRRSEVVLYNQRSNKDELQCAASTTRCADEDQDCGRQLTAGLSVLD